jgi:hypothetical protein
MQSMGREFRNLVGLGDDSIDVSKRRAEGNVAEKKESREAKTPISPADIKSRDMPSAREKHISRDREDASKSSESKESKAPASAPAMQSLSKEKNEEIITGSFKLYNDIVPKMGGTGSGASMRVEIDGQKFLCAGGPRAHLSAKKLLNEHLGFDTYLHWNVVFLIEKHIPGDVMSGQMAMTEFTLARFNPDLPPDMRLKMAYMEDLICSKFGDTVGVHNVGAQIQEKVGNFVEAAKGLPMPNITPSEKSISYRGAFVQGEG